MARKVEKKPHELRKARQGDTWRVILMVNGSTADHSCAVFGTEYSTEKLAERARLRLCEALGVQP